MTSIFDKDTIRNNCEKFFSLYNVAKAGTLEICIRKTEHTRMIDDIIPNYEDICEVDQLLMEKAVYYHSNYRLPDDLADIERYRHRAFIFCLRMLYLQSSDDVLKLIVLQTEMVEKKNDGSLVMQYCR